jgi:PST family polysaccharide transporter
MAYRAVAVADAFLYLVLYGGLSVVLALGGWGFRGLVIAQTVSELASAILMLVVSRAPLGLTSDLRGLRPMLSYGLGLTAANAADSLAEGLPKIFAGNALGAVALGCYGRAWDVTRRVNTALEEVSSKVLFPAFALRQDSPRVLGQLYSRYLPVSLAAMIPAGVILAAAREDVILLLLGRGWEQAVVPFGVFALLLPVQSTRKITLTVLNSLGRSGRNLMVNAVTCAVVLAALPFAVRLGLPGVAGAIFLASFCGAVLAQGAALRALGVRPLEMIRAQAPPVLDGLLVAGGCWAATALLHRYGVTTPLVRMLALGASGALAGGLGLLVLPQVFAPTHLRELFNRWWALVPRLTRRSPPWDETGRSGGDG